MSHKNSFPKSDKHNFILRDIRFSPVLIEQGVSSSGLPLAYNACIKTQLLHQNMKL
jgi:hypothetical protein